MIRELNAHDFLYMLMAARWTVLLSIIAITAAGCLALWSRWPGCPGLRRCG